MEEIEKENKMDWNVFWKAAAVIVAIFALLIGGFASLSSQISGVSKELILIRRDIADVQREIAVMKTVMFMKGVLPAELATSTEK